MPKAPLSKIDNFRMQSITCKGQVQQLPNMQPTCPHLGAGGGGGGRNSMLRGIGGGVGGRQGVTLENLGPRLATKCPGIAGGGGGLANA